MAAHDLHEARLGHAHALVHRRDETEAAVRAQVQRWLAGDAVSAARFGAFDRVTLFAVYWAGTMLPADSECFIAVSRPACEGELAFWLGRVRSNDAAFLAAYARAPAALALPPLGPNP